jgi:multidrug efflux system membrane fusion protein
MTPRTPLVALAAAVLAACSREGAGTTSGPRPVPVRVGVAVERDVPVELQAVGRIVSAASVQVRAQVSGELVAARFTEGQNVRQGEVLLEIDRRPYAAAVAEARARLAQDQVRATNARDDAARYAELVGKDYVTRQQHDAARAAADAAAAQVAADEAALERARLNLAYCTLRAPISGRTGKRRVDPGNLVVAGAPEPLVTIEQVRPVFAEFAVPERNLGALLARRASPPPVAVRAAGGTVATGTLTFVDNAVDPATGTVLLRARLPNEDEALWPGQSVEARVKVAERTRAIVVPASAVASGQQGDYTFVVGPDRKAQLRPVVVDVAGEREAALASGVAAGETVVVEGQLRLRPGALVEPLQDEKAPEKAAAPSPAPPHGAKERQGRAR